MEKTVSKEKVKATKTTNRKWFLVDAKGKVIGRVATKIATILRGKENPSFVPYLDSGDYVVVINAAKVAATGRKEDNKNYYRYSGYPGGLKETNLKTLRAEKPGMIIAHAVAGMLPKNRLGKAVIKKLYIYAGDEHPHHAQNLEKVEV